MFKFILGLVIGNILGFFCASLCCISKDAEERDRELFEKEFGNGDEN